MPLVAFIVHVQNTLTLNFVAW